MRRSLSAFLAFTVFASTALNGGTVAFAEVDGGLDGGGTSTEAQADGIQWEDAFQKRLAQIPGNEGVSLSGEVTEKNRQILDFNTNWLFIRGDDMDAKDQDYDDSGAEDISLPHARRNYDLYQPDINDIQTVDWYRRHFTISAEDQGNRVFVEFNGGGQINNVYVNGTMVGQAKGTFTHFKFDITDYITFGDFDNVIAVQVDSRYHSDTMPPGVSKDFHMFGGLHGRAEMTITDNAYVESAFYWNEEVTTEDSAATVNGKIEIKNKYPQPQEITVRSILKKDGEEASVQEKTETVEAGAITTYELIHTVEDPLLWSPSNPYLYTASTEILIQGMSVDQYEDNIGIRTLSATKPTEENGHFSLNGEQIELVGGNRHMMAPNLGNSLTQKLNEKDAYTMKYDLGINLVRTSHYETDPSFLDACDRIGLMVEEEALGWNDTPGWDQFCYSAEEMVKRDRNHASIVMWSITPNERPVNYPSVESSKERQAKTKELDPSRLTIQEEFKSSEIIADVYGWHDYAVPGKFSTPRREVKSWFVTEWNTNLGKYFVIPGDSETRKRNQVVEDGLKLGYFMDDPRIMGNLKWDIFGYYTPNHANQRGKNVNLYRCSGVYGLWRDPLHKTWIAYLMQAQSDVAEIGDVLKICSEWKSDSDHSIYVVSNLDEVELYYDNGSGEAELIERLAGPNVYEDKLAHGMFLYQLPEGTVWAKGSRLIAKGYSGDNTLPEKEDIVWASTYESEKEGANLILHNTMEQDFNAGITLGGLEADGSDVAWILAELVDQNGQREYYGDEHVTLDLDGPGELVYAGNNPIMADGLSGFYLRSNLDETGTATVTASVDMGENYDDGDASVTYDGNWTAVDSKIDAYGGGLHQTTAAGATATIQFTGTQIVLYAESGPKNGTASITVDGNLEKANLSNESKYDTISNQAIYRSPVLEYGQHMLTMKADSGKPVNIDRIKVFDGESDLSETIDIDIVPSSADRVHSDRSLPKAEAPEVNTIEVLKLLLEEANQVTLSNYKVEEQIRLEEAIEFAVSVVEMNNPPMSIISKAVVQLRAAMVISPYVTKIMHTTSVMEGQEGAYYYSEVNGTWVTGNSTYANKNRTPNDYVEITFDGCKIQLFTDKDIGHGLAAISVDDGPEVKVDQHADVPKPNSLYYTSENLEPGLHKVKVRVTGETSGNPDNACISFKYAIVHKELDPLQESKALLAASLANADVLDRSLYSLDTLDRVDAAAEEAASVLKNPSTDIEMVEKVKAELDEAIAALEDSGQSATILCSNRAEEDGQLNKVNYVAQSTEWVDEDLGDDSKQNTYLRKINQTAKEDYCELVFEGTKIDLYAKCSQSSGLAWIQIDDQTEDEWESISLYADVSPMSATVQKFYTSPELSEGRHTLRLITQNKAAEENTDATLTSINFSKAIVSGDVQTADISELKEVIDRVNQQTPDEAHEQLWAAFQEKVLTAVRNSYGLVSGTFPELELVDPMPAGTTGVRIKRVVTMFESAILTLNGQLEIASVSSLTDITVPYGTRLEDIPFPERVKSMTSDAQPIYLSIEEWAAEDVYDQETPGSYIFAGKLVLEDGLCNTRELTAEIKIKVAEPDEVFYNINAVLEGGQNAVVTVIDQALPGDKVTVQISDIPEDWEFDSISATAEFTERKPQTDPAESVLPDEEEIESDLPNEEAPEAETPDEEEPEAEIPDGEEPEAEIPDEEESEAETPDGEEPEAENPDEEESEVETPDGEEVETETSGEEEIEAETLEVEIEAEAFVIAEIETEEPEEDEIEAEEIDDEILDEEIVDESLEEQEIEDESSDWEEQISQDATVTKASDSNAQPNDTEDDSDDSDDSEDDDSEPKIKKITLTELMPGEEYRFVMPEADVTVTVTLKEHQSVQVERVTVSGPDTMKIGDTVTFRAQVAPANAEYEGIQWNVIGDAAKYEASGDKLTLTGVKAGTVMVSALAGGIESNELTISVTKKPSSGSGSGSSSGGSRKTWSYGADVNTYGPGVNLALTTEEIFNKLNETARGESLTIRTGMNGLLDISVLNALREKYLDKLLVVKGDGYQWTFSGKNLTAPAEGITQLDTTIQRNSPNQAAITALTGGAEVQLLHFNHQGQLPGRVQIGIFCDAYALGHVNVYYYNSQNQQLELAGKNRAVDKYGWFDFEATQGGSYVISKTELTGAMKP